MATGPVTTWDEASIARWLFQADAATTPLRRMLRLPVAAAVRLRVPISDFPWHRSGPGDIDVLICDPTLPDESIGIECKRITVRSDTFATECPGRLSGFKRGHVQVQSLLDLGIHRVFLLAIVEIDSTQRDHLGVFDRGLTPELRARIEQAAAFEKVTGRAGFAIATIEQHRSEGLEVGGMVTVEIVRNAGGASQPPILTERIRTLFG